MKNNKIIKIIFSAMSLVVIILLIYFISAAKLFVGIKEYLEAANVWTQGNYLKLARIYIIGVISIILSILLITALNAYIWFSKASYSPELYQAHSEAKAAKKRAKLEAQKAKIEDKLKDD
jgi:type III secretory pathway component EscU